MVESSLAQLGILVRRGRKSCLLAQDPWDVLGLLGAWEGRVLGFYTCSSQSLSILLSLLLVLLTSFFGVGTLDVDSKTATKYMAHSFQRVGTYFGVQFVAYFIILASVFSGSFSQEFSTHQGVGEGTFAELFISAFFFGVAFVVTFVSSSRKSIVTSSLF